MFWSWMINASDKFPVMVCCACIPVTLSRRSLGLNSAQAYIKFLPQILHYVLI